MIEPNFFIVGAAKSGTTSLWSYLRQHPQIYMPEIKEPSFFSFHYKHKLTYEKYLSLFSGVLEKKAKVIGEASHAYLTSPESAALIRESYPDAKFIIILRNPIDRAFSLYQWMVREGYEWIYPFEKALEIEEERTFDEEFRYNNPQYYYNYLYYRSGLYSNQIERYVKLFKKDRIKFLIFDDFKKNTLSNIKEIYHFLEVDSNFYPEVSIKNKMEYPFSVLLQFFFRNKFNRIMRKIGISKSIRKKIVSCAMDINIYIGSAKKEILSVKTKKNLTSRYHNDIMMTSNLIERDLGIWL